MTSQNLLERNRVWSEFTSLFELIVYELNSLSRVNVMLLMVVTGLLFLVCKLSLMKWSPDDDGIMKKNEGLFLVSKKSRNRTKSGNESAQESDLSTSEAGSSSSKSEKVISDQQTSTLERKAKIKVLPTNGSATEEKQRKHGTQSQQQDTPTSSNLSTLERLRLKKSIDATKTTDTEKQKSNKTDGKKSSLQSKRKNSVVEVATDNEEGKSEKSKTASLRKICLGKLPPVIDSKSLRQDEIFDILQSTSDQTPTHLKTVIIRNFTSTNPNELNVKKNEVVYILFKQKELLYVKNKKGNKGFIPFVCSSCSVEETNTLKKKGSKKASKKSSISSTTSTDSIKDSAKPIETSKPQPTKLVPLKDSSSSNTLVTGSPVIQHSSIETLSDADYLEEKEQAVQQLRARSLKFNKRPRSRSVDQLLSANPIFDSKESVSKSGDELERPVTSLGSHREPFLDSGFQSDFSEISKESSIERFLTPLTRRKFFKKQPPGSISEKDMKKLKLFARGKNKDRVSGQRSDSSVKMSDSEMSSTSSTIIVKKNNKKNNKVQKQTRLVPQYDWYTNLFNDVSTDSSDSEDDCTTTDTDSIRVSQRKPAVLKTENCFDYERYRSSDRGKLRRSSDTSASSDLYLPQPMIPKTVREHNSTDEDIGKHGGSGFAQIHKTKTIQTKKTNLPSDTTSLQKEDKQTKNDTTETVTPPTNEVKTETNEEKKTTTTNSKTAANSMTNLQKNRLSSSSNNIRTSIKGKKKNYASDNEVDRLLSPLTVSKTSKIITKPLEEKTTKSSVGKVKRPAPQPPVAPAINNNKMIVSYDFFAAEETDVTILTGQQVEVLRKPDVDWWWVKIPDGREGFVPKTFLSPIPTIPTRKPDLLKRLNSTGVESEVNNNNAPAAQNLKANQAKSAVINQTYQRDSPKLAKVAPRMRNEYGGQSIDDIALYKKHNMPEFYNGRQYKLDQPMAPPTYNQFMMTRQKSDLSDKYHVNKRQMLIEYQQQKGGMNKNWKSQDDNSKKVEATHDPGGASRIVRRRSFSGRQKKVRFANEVDSTDRQEYQNSPGQILIIRQNSFVMGDIQNNSFDTEPPNDEQEVEIATWC